MNPEPLRKSQTQAPLEFKEMTGQVQTVFNDESHELGEAINLAIASAVKSAIANNKKSQVAMNLTFKPGRGNDISVLATVVTKLPKPEQLATHFFRDQRGRLFDQDPQQPTFDNVVPMKGKESSDQ